MNPECMRLIEDCELKYRLTQKPKNTKEQSLLGKRLHKDSAIEGPSSERTKAPKSADIRAALEKKLALRANSSAANEEKLLVSPDACIELFNRFESALSVNKRRTVNLDAVLRAA